jgi:hypothetical protein
MIQSSKNRAGSNTATDLNCTRKWRILCQTTGAFDTLIFRNLAQMSFAQDNDVVHIFTPDRSDQLKLLGDAR